MTDEDIQEQQKLYGQLMMGKELDSRVQAATKLLLRPPRGFAALKQPKPGLSAAKLPATAASPRHSLEAWLFLPFPCCWCCSEQRQEGKDTGSNAACSSSALMRSGAEGSIAQDSCSLASLWVRCPGRERKHCLTKYLALQARGGIPWFGCSWS